jgi:hypothetical protein
MRVIEVYFEVALYPLNQEVEENKIKDEVDDELDDSDDIIYQFVKENNIFNKYICKLEQVKYVLKYLQEFYDFNGDSDIYYNSLKYDEYTSLFSIKIILTDEDNNISTVSNEEISNIVLDELIYPGEDGNKKLYLFIGKDSFTLDIKVSYYEDINDMNDINEDINDDINEDINDMNDDE